MEDTDLLLQEKEEFCQLLLSTRRKNIDKVLLALEDMGFFEAPASRKDHLAFDGGLMTHSLNTYHMAVLLAKDLQSLRPTLQLDADSIKIAALLHDVCKAPRYHKNAKGDIEKDSTNLPVGHGEKSVIMLLRLALPLTDDEILAIRWHMGPWQLPLHNAEQQEDYKSATRSHPLVSLIHTADTLATEVLEQ